MEQVDRLFSPKFWLHPLVNPKVAGKSNSLSPLTLLIISIVEFASDEDAKRAKVELADKQLLGRPVFIREVTHLHYDRERY